MTDPAAEPLLCGECGTPIRARADHEGDGVAYRFRCDLGHDHGFQLDGGTLDLGRYGPPDTPNDFAVFAEAFTEPPEVGVTIIDPGGLLEHLPPEAEA